MAGRLVGKARVLAVLIGAASIVGCGANQHARGVVGSTLITGEGKVLPALVGSWRSKEELYNFNQDGSYVEHYDEIVATGPTTKGKRVGGTKGKWSATDKVLILEVSTGARHELLYSLGDGDQTLSLRPSYVKANLAKSFKHEK